MVTRDWAVGKPKTRAIGAEPDPEAYLRLPGPDSSLISADLPPGSIVTRRHCARARTHALAPSPPTPLQGRVNG